MSLTIRPMRFAHSEGHTDFCFTDDGKHIITCGNDGDIRVWTGIDDDEPESYCVGESAYSVVQKNDYVYVCTDDSKVLMLKYPSCERDGLLTRFTAPATHIAVAKDKNILACVSEDFSVKVLDLPQDTNGTTFNELTGPGISLALSSNGKLLAVSSGDGKMYVWNLETKTLLKYIDCVPYTNSFATTKLLCRASFDPKSKFLAYPDNKDVIIVTTDQLKEVCRLKDDDIKGSLSIVQFSPCGKYIAASSQNGEVCVWAFQSKTFIGITTHPEKYNICSLQWNPQDNGEITFCDINGQIGTIDVSPSDDLLPELAVEEDNTDGLNFNFDNDDDENTVSLEKLKNDTLRPTSAQSLGFSNDNGSRAQSPERARTPPINLQSPFQPSSTPAHLEQRFLVYNDVGVIQAFNDGEPSIDIQFHDVNISRNIYLKNVLNHTMGSVSSKVIALACETPSKLVCIPTEASNKQWSIEMTELEEILCVTASVNLVAVATDSRFLRVFSTYGTQRAVLSIPGPVVALSSFKNSILVVYHATTTYSKDQNLAGMLVQFEGLTVKSNTISLPLTPESTLTWLGFTDSGSIVTYDSTGIIRQQTQLNTWIPIFDASAHAKGASDSYFITSVSEASQTVNAVHCKGAMYPQTTPRPILIELPMQSLMCELGTDKSMLEEKVFRWSNSGVLQPENSFKEAVVKLFVLACRNELDERALELLTITGSAQLTNLGLKYANRLNRKRLVDKLTDLLNFLEGNEEQQNDEQEQNGTVRQNGTPYAHESKENDSQSQDIFSQSPLTSKTPNTQDIIFSKPSQGGNPFLKKRAENQIRKNPLGLTDVTISYENLPSTSKSTATVIVEKKTEIEKKISNSPAPKETFVDWFTKEKSNLSQEHPDLSPTELTQIALKMFKNSEKRKASDEEGGKRKQPKLSAFAFSKSK